MLGQSLCPWVLWLLTMPRKLCRPVSCAIAKGDALRQHAKAGIDAQRQHLAGVGMQIALEYKSRKLPEKVHEDLCL